MDIFTIPVAMSLAAGKKFVLKQRSLGVDDTTEMATYMVQV